LRLFAITRIYCQEQRLIVAKREGKRCLNRREGTATRFPCLGTWRTPAEKGSFAYLHDRQDQPDKGWGVRKRAAAYSELLSYAQEDDFPTDRRLPKLPQSVVAEGSLRRIYVEFVPEVNHGWYAPCLMPPRSNNATVTERVGKDWRELVRANQDLRAFLMGEDRRYLRFYWLWSETRMKHERRMCQRRMTRPSFASALFLTERGPWHCKSTSTGLQTSDRSTSCHDGGA
jgi:hypothetical protein